MLSEITDFNTLLSTKPPFCSADRINVYIFVQFAIRKHYFADSAIWRDTCHEMMLRGLRGKEELTQAKFAKRLGISQPTSPELKTSSAKPAWT